MASWTATICEIISTRLVVPNRRPRDSWKALADFHHRRILYLGNLAHLLELCMRRLSKPGVNVLHVAL
jgi:hypothetical protein